MAASPAAFSCRSILVAFAVVHYIDLAELSESEADELRVCTSTYSDFSLGWFSWFGEKRMSFGELMCSCVFHDAGSKHEGATWWLYSWCKSQPNNFQRGQLITQVAY